MLINGILFILTGMLIIKFPDLIAYFVGFIFVFIGFSLIISNLIFKQQFNLYKKGYFDFFKFKTFKK